MRPANANEWASVMGHAARLAGALTAALLGFAPVAWAQASAPLSLTPWRIANSSNGSVRVGNVVSEDADKDGFVDFMAAGYPGATHHVFLNNASGVLGLNADGTPRLHAGVLQRGGWQPRFIDLNNDGFHGYVIAGGRGLYYRDRDAQGFVGSGEREIATAWCSSCGINGTPRYGEMTYLDVGDINGDGFQDAVAIGNRWNPNIRMFLNDGAGSLVPSTIIPYPGGTWDGSGVLLRDMDGDGKLDIVFSKLVEPNSPPAPNLYRNNGDGTFTAVNLPGIVSAQRLAVADANGDGQPDIFMSGVGQNHANGSWVVGSTSGVWLFTNQGGLQFGMAKVVEGSVGGFDAGDLNGDGLADLALSFGRAEWWLEYPRVLTGNGSGGFTEVWSYDAPAVDADNITILRYNGRPALATGGYYASWLYADFSEPLVCEDAAYDAGGTCEPCGTNCTACTAADACSACETGFVLSSGACVPESVDCEVSEWSAWSECSLFCGGGVQSRSREVAVAPAGDGQACPALEEAQACNTHACDTDGDGVTDDLDDCPGTASGAMVNASGCDGEQAVDLACAPDAFSSGSDYLSCVRSVANAAKKAGLLSGADYGTIVSERTPRGAGAKR